jgi:hypothetical protein
MRTAIIIPFPSPGIGVIRGHRWVRVMFNGFLLSGVLMDQIPMHALKKDTIYSASEYH